MLALHCSVLTYDRRGRGSSGDAENSSVADEINDLAAVVASAPDGSTLFGFSSGAALALHAAAAGLPVERVVALEPPVDLDGEPDEEFLAELQQLLSAGHRGRAVEYFNRAIGVPDELLENLASGPAWPVSKRLRTLTYMTNRLHRHPEQGGGQHHRAGPGARERGKRRVSARSRSSGRGRDSVRQPRTLAGKSWHGPDASALVDAIMRA